MRSNRQRSILQQVVKTLKCEMPRRIKLIFCLGSVHRFRIRPHMHSISLDVFFQSPTKEAEEEPSSV
ncbi:hypothetical protein CEE69_28160 [Rhodopirellula bahusiensis]|uniref:Uncharacterized protein n=1 Tax=Rhodopirellula bahusiensis TaxID=2014065 RepID=A0A2G1VYT6_9BACT|nr:hypothetical protein CEE69_28160 [Rhodopirellula bahusiensis]